MNAVLNCYKHCDYEEQEMEMLKEKFDSYATKSDTERKKQKEQTRELDYFFFDWDDLQERYQHWKQEYNQFGCRNALINWVLSALISDEDFGCKRPSDICNLSHYSIKDTKISFTTEKNKFKYESRPLSQHILEPLTEKNKSLGYTYVLTTAKFTKFTPENLLHRLKKVLGRTDVNFHSLRRLWASYKYSQHPKPQEFCRQIYELTHEANTHTNDYLLDYRTDVFSDKVYYFKKTTKWVKC